MHRLISFTAAMLLTFAVSGLGAQTTDQPAQPGEQVTDDIEQLVDKLEDPAERERLIAELKLLLEAQQSREVAAAKQGSGSVIDVVKGIFEDFWDQATSIDPTQLAISSMISAGILIAAFLVRWLVLSLVRRLYARLTHESPDDEEDEGEPTPETAADAKATADRVELPAAITRVVNLVVGVLAVALIAESWGGGLTELLQTDIGVRIAETAVAVGLILLITVALWHASEMLVTRLLKLGTRKHDRDRTARRLETLVPLLSSILQATIGVMAALLILSELGVNIGPLLAGAGILGLAVGFGAQTLVKDLITGVTILLEDSATVGDVIEVAGHAGAVEEMRIRVIQLRDISGNVHLIPYSEVSSIKNFTKDFSYYLFDVGVAYREDTDEVCKVLMEISDDMAGDEVHGPNIMEPLQILGLDRFADSAVVVRARLKTLPGQQWGVGREFNRRIKKRFDELGIEIPFPHTTVYFGESKDGKAPPMQLALTGEGAKALAGGSG